MIFYAALAAFFSIYFALFYQTIDANKPKWQLNNGIIGSNPGLSIRPMSENSVEIPIVDFNSTEGDYWISALDDFLYPYEEAQNYPSTNSVDCDEKKPKDGEVCRVDVSKNKFGSCTRDNHYGYTKGSPCIFLKLNRIYGWMPEYYSADEMLPQKMPEHLQDYMKYYHEKNQNLDAVWVSCEGESPLDVENLGPINFSSRYFPGYYFPYVNQRNYLSPIIAINIERPTTGVVISIECKAWAQNIFHDRADRLGSVRFKLRVD